MIIGNMKEASSGFGRYPESVREALEFLRSHDFTTMEDSVAILQRYETREPDSGKPEAHRRYVDVQYIVSGREEMGWCPMSPELKVCDPYDQEKDIVFFDNLIPISGIELAAGDFAVLYPTDVHRPCGSPEGGPQQVTKVVVKIAIDHMR